MFTITSISSLPQNLYLIRSPFSRTIPFWAFRSDAGFLKGGVVDFIDLQWWPVFNIADAAIVLGGVMMFWLGLKSGQVKPEDSDISDSISDLHE